MNTRPLPPDVTSGARDGSTNHLTRGLFALGLLTLVAGVLVGAVAPGASLPVADGANTGDGVRQVDPATARADGDLSSIERRLAGQVIEQVRSGALNLSAEDRENVVSSLNTSRLDGLLSRYSGVANRTGNRNTSRQVVRLQQFQQRYAVLFERYWDLHGNYENLSAVGTAPGQAALTHRRGRFATPGDLRVLDGPEAEGNRTRRLARKMEQTWLELNETGHQLVEQYRVTGNLARGNYEDAVDSVVGSLTNVSRTQSEVRREVFVRTRFDDLDVGSRAISFTDPLQVEGRLVTTAGDPIGSRTVNVTLGNRTLPVRLDDAGRFELTYRPTRLRRNATELRLAVQPPNRSIYLGTRTAVDVSVSQVTPTVNVSTPPEAVRYHENLTIAGRIAAEGTGVPRIPYVLVVGDRFVTTNVTGEDGQFERTLSVPADVEPGDTGVEVRVATSGLAIGNATGIATATVVKTATSLDLSATPRQGREVRVSGRFHLHDGGPVADQRVEISADGRFLASFETDPDGTFDGVVLVPSDLAGGSETVTIAGEYAAEGTNLGPSTADVEVGVTTTSGSIVPIAVGILVLLGVVGLLLWRRPWTRIRGERPGFGGTDDGAGTEGGELSIASEDGTTSKLVDLASQRFEAGDHGAAVQLGYAALRSRLAPAVEEADRQTHWEFYQSCRDAGLDEGTRRTLRRTTEAYERIRFAADAPSKETAREILDSIGGLEAVSRQGGTDD